ncbi:MAG: sulfite exporter TauE/SafE family protein [Oscillospiraceae bacterium]|nr:sulfite exporter TauE/SafE family protein [Oscillospiraceae bacterium]
MTWIWSALAAFGAGALGAMGLGGGGILVIYLTLMVGMPQLQAQGVNLLFFLPCAVISIIINAKRKLIDWRNALWIALGGLPATLLGIWLSDLIDGRWIGYMFAGLLIFIGLRELFSGLFDKLLRKKA